MLLDDYIRSTPFRIATAYVAVFFLSAVILFGLVFWLVTDEMKGALRRAVDHDIASLTAVYHVRGAAGLREAIEGRLADARDSESLYMLQSADGNLIAGDGLVGDLTVGWQEATATLESARRDNDGAPERFLARGARAGDSLLVVGRRLFGLTEVQEILFRSLVWASGITALMALVGGIMLGRGALCRVDSINRVFDEIKEGNLDRRVPPRGTRDELDRLVVNINAMLDRIEILMGNLQQVTNDIAHDLRTPLSRLRHGLEAARRKGSPVGEYEAAIDRAIEQTDTILETFSALLRIAQIESRVRRGRFAKVDLSDISKRIVEAYESVLEDANQTFRADIAPDVQVPGDKDLLTQLLANLVENAMQHCPPGTRIQLALSNGMAPTLVVSDTGSGIPAEAREQVLKRFFRLDGSRTSPGSGLGLALVKAISDMHGATLTLLDNQPGLRVELRFPRQRV
jgi:signal transduction histidine kinase